VEKTTRESGVRKGRDFLSKLELRGEERELRSVREIGRKGGGLVSGEEVNPVIHG